MSKPGFSMHFFPSSHPDHDYVLMMYSDAWEDGTCIQSAGLQREGIDIDVDWIMKIPEDQFAVLALEIANQVVVSSVSLTEKEAFRKTVAEEVRAAQTLSQDM